MSIATIRAPAAPLRPAAQRPKGHFLDEQAAIEFQALTGDVDRPISRLVVEIPIDGQPTVMLIPIMLLNGGMMGIQPKI